MGARAIGFMIRASMVLALGVVLCGAAQPREAQEMEDYATFEVSRLRCVIGNNAALGEHAARYNGLFSMWSPDQDVSPFVPSYAGFNLEHYFDASPRHEDGDIMFEPRVAPMTFSRVDEQTAELRQPRTPHFGVESWTRYQLKDPHYIDVTFRCVAHRDDMANGFFGMFWASYMNGPLNKSIYFLRAGSTLDKPQWLQFCTQEHDHCSTVLSESDDGAVAFEDGSSTLWNQFSPLRYSVPFYYGRIRNMVLVYIFEPDANVRFSHSPSGGGRAASGDDTNPAWDFQFIVPEYQPGKEYRLRARVVYKPWVDRADVIAEVRKYYESLGESEQ
ncbi:MAG: hypothetical protein GY851_25090 [bacterium]|nr:hypothetical protein [bacterium]